MIDKSVCNLLYTLLSIYRRIKITRKRLKTRELNRKHDWNEHCCVIWNIATNILTW